ncbi:ABC transporter permease [Paenibacillus alvei]|uniref:ABC transporter permease n=1 Tax=Paenibacillus alvei TaxID=44250 RepID=UPI0022812368|nr:ABC-2 family transporter protein [Paenibacillus alvei]
MRHYIKVYIFIIFQYMKIKLEYRFDFFVSSIGLILTSLSGIFTFLILFESIPSLAGWSFFELLFIYSFSMLASVPMQVMFDNIWSLGDHLERGTFIKYYFKPLNMMFYYMSEVFDIKGISQFLLALSLLIYTSIQLDLKWGFLELLLFIFNLFGASLIIISLMIIAGSTAFWFTHSRAALQFTFKLKDFSRYPISIFGKAFRFVFICIIPTSFISFFPSILFIRPSEASIISYMAPIVGIIMFYGSYLIWNKGVNTYTGTGS